MIYGHTQGLINMHTTLNALQGCNIFMYVYVPQRYWVKWTQLYALYFFQKLHFL